MTKFIRPDTKITEEAKPGEKRILKLDTQSQPTVQEFALPKIRKLGDGDYSVTRSKFGPLAATDPERLDVNRKDARFSLNSLVKEPLSIATEELRVIETKVAERVSAIEDEARQRAMEFGFEEGRKQGYQEAFQRFELECKARIETFNQFLTAFEGAKTEVFRANEEFLVSLVFRIARMVILKELSTDREYVVRLAKDIIERVGLRENIRIGISAAESLTLEQMKEMLEKQLGELKNLHIEVSPKVKMGGCMVETEFNAIDAMVETQLQGLLNAAKGAPTT